ncbi:MAG: TIGR01777 family protein, partial [Kofleriaceae bacterium]|nr:TIGR01777 family protein [Kofleriaceae bacterium]
MNVVVTGATGLIGTALVGKLLESGHNVTALIRDLRRPPKVAAKRPEGAGLGDLENVQADIEAPGAWCESLANAQAVVHLAGEPVAAKRWDARQKQAIRDSRVESTRTIVEAIGKLPAEQRPNALVVASGVDYYPFAITSTDFDDDAVTESEAPGDTFLARVCRDWEREAQAATAFGVRVVNMRTGLVLAKRGGALAKMRRPFELFVGGRIGSGLQWVSWIHLDDVVAAYAAATEDARYTGPINLVTDSARNAEFSKQLAAALHRPSLLPVPAFALKLAVCAEF